MPIGVRDMGFNTATNLFLMNGMTKPNDPKAGDMFLCTTTWNWKVFNGKQWIDVNLQKHKCDMPDEKSVQD